jgi:hypothetical protein
MLLIIANPEILTDHGLVALTEIASKICKNYWNNLKEFQIKALQHTLKKNVTQPNFVLNIIKPENYFLAGTCKKIVFTK